MNTDWKNQMQCYSKYILVCKKQYLNSYSKLESEKETPKINFKVPLTISQVILMPYLFFQDNLEPCLHIPSPENSS